MHDAADELGLTDEQRFCIERAQPSRLPDGNRPGFVKVWKPGPFGSVGRLLGAAREELASGVQQSGVRRT